MKKLILSTLVGILSVQIVSAALLVNIDLGNQTSSERGFAATGLTTNDFWNGVSSKYLSVAVFSGLLDCNGNPTPVTFSVTNAPGEWPNGSSDAMYNLYNYNTVVGNPAQAQLSNLPAGTYDLYLYSDDGNYGVQVGNTNYGVKTTSDSPISDPPPWQDGRQYAVFKGLIVQPGEAIDINISPGIYGVAMLSGLQLALVSANTATLSLALYPGLNIQGVVGLTYGIQYTTDLSNTNSWVGLTNITPTQSQQLWLDLRPATLPHGYYRIVPGPISIP